MKEHLLIWLVLCCAAASWAQDAPIDAISLKDAVRMATEGNKTVEASVAAGKEANSRVAQAQSGKLPKVNYSESWSRSDNPVFVFSSLLTQRQFGERNFQIGPLNRPNFLNNFQSQVIADQTIYDAGQTKHAVRSAELTRDLTSANIYGRNKLLN